MTFPKQSLLRFPEIRFVLGIHTFLTAFFTLKCHEIMAPPVSKSTKNFFCPNTLDHLSVVGILVRMKTWHYSSENIWASFPTLLLGPRLLSVCYLQHPSLVSATTRFEVPLGSLQLYHSHITYITLKEPSLLGTASTFEKGFV